MKRPAAFCSQPFLPGPLDRLFTLPAGADESTRVRSRVTVQLRNIRQRLVFQLRGPVSGGSFVSEVSYQPGK